MSLPSVEFLKDQATRLVTYLGDKHRFRLKPASALEAVAAMYDKHDWNTLHGLAQRMTGEGARVGAAAPTALPDSFPLTWSEQGEPQLTVTREDWYRHTLATGGALTDRQAWLQQHFVEHRERCGAGVFVNAFGKLSIAAREALHGERLLVDLVSEDSTFYVNLMADMEPHDIAAMTTALIFMRERSRSDDYWKQSATMVLAIVARALREVGENVTLARLAELFPPMASPTRLRQLMLSLDVESDSRKLLESILAPHDAGAGAFSEKTWGAHYGLLSRALAQLSESSWTSGLFSAAPGAKGLFSLLNEGKCLVIECAERSAGLPERAVLYAMRSAMTARRDKPWDSRLTPWVLAMSDAEGCWCSALADLVARGRSAQLALLLTAGDAEGRSVHAAGHDVRDNVWNVIHLRGCSPAELADLLAKMADRPVLVQPNRVTAAI